MGILSKWMQFDTRKVKPKLFHLLAFTVGAVLTLIVMILSGADEHAMAISAFSAAYFLIVVILLVDAFFKQIQYNPYSYNTIIYFGFALFFLSICLTYLWITAEMAMHPEQRTAVNLVSVLHSSGKGFIYLSSPFILIFSVALFISNVSLIRHEGRRFVNILGIILSFLLVAGLIFIFAFDYYVTGSYIEVMIHDLVTSVLSSIYLYFECMIIGAIVADVIAAKYEPEKDKDFLIILGCGLRKDGTPTPLLCGRCDRAIDFARRQKEETGKDLMFITSGGQGPREVTSECASMKRYLMEQGIPEEQIIEEDQSRNTFENMKFSKVKILERNPEGKIAFSTTNYHVFRSGLYARRNKMRAVGMGAKTKWYFWPNASVREFVGILTEHRGKQALVFGSLIVAYTAMTLFVYLYWR